MDKRVDKRSLNFSFKKAICSGNILEVLEYEKAICSGHKGGNNQGKKIASNNKRDNNISSAKKRLRRLINANIKPQSKFITLTYSENMKDIKKAKNDFKTFIKYLVRNGYKNPKYVYVVEFQKRGAVHFHCIFFDMPYIKASQLSELWKHGFVKINKIDNVDNVGAYVVKYMDKDLTDDRLVGSDLYGRSRGNLDEPLEFNEDKEISLLVKAYENNETYEIKYQTEYYGQVIYKQYNLNRNTKQGLKTVNE